MLAVQLVRQLVAAPSSLLISPSAPFCCGIPPRVLLVAALVGIAAGLNVFQLFILGYLREQEDLPFGFAVNCAEFWCAIGFSYLVAAATASSAGGAAGGGVAGDSPPPPPASAPTPPWIALRMGLPGVLLAVANGLDLKSLELLDLRLRVLIRACKLIPVMAMAWLLRRRQASVVDVVVVLSVCSGLALYVSQQQAAAAAADSDEESSRLAAGLVIAALSLVFDIAALLLQEHLLKSERHPPATVMFYMNLVGAIFSTFTLVTSGDLALLPDFVRAVPLIGVAIATEGAIASLGIYLHLVLIQQFSAVAATISTAVRKTLSLSVVTLVLDRVVALNQLLAIALIVAGLAANGLSELLPTATSSSSHATVAIVSSAATAATATAPAASPAAAKACHAGDEESLIEDCPLPGITVHVMHDE